MIEASNAARALLLNRTLRLATLWEILRADTTALRFTDHDGAITYGGDTYSPADSFQASAVSAQDSMRGQEVEAVGIISDSAISHDDLKAGKYDGAQITEYLVDWRYPWTGAFRTTRYFMQGANFDGVQWKADISGLTALLEPARGQVYSRICKHAFGDAGCKITLATYTISGATVTAVTSRLQFTASHASFTGKAAGDYNYGLARFTSHANYEMEIKESTAAVGTEITFSLVLPTPFDHAISDGLTVIEGCDHIVTTCNNRFSNLVNFGGYPHMPGTDRILQTPTK